MPHDNPRAVRLRPAPARRRARLRPPHPGAPRPAFGSGSRRPRRLRASHRRHRHQRGPRAKRHQRPIRQERAGRRRGHRPRDAHEPVRRVSTCGRASRPGETHRHPWRPRFANRAHQHRRGPDRPAGLQSDPRLRGDGRRRQAGCVQGFGRTRNQRHLHRHQRAALRPEHQERRLRGCVRRPPRRLPRRFGEHDQPQCVRVCPAPVLLPPLLQPQQPVSPALPHARSLQRRFLENPPRRRIQPRASHQPHARLHRQRPRLESIQRPAPHHPRLDLQLRRHDHQPLLPQLPVAGRPGQWVSLQRQPQN